MANKIKKHVDVQPVSFFALFRFSTWFERVMLFIATAACIAIGVIFPLNFLLTGDLVDSFIGYNVCIRATQGNCTLFNVGVFNKNVPSNKTILFVNIEASFISFALYFTCLACAAGGLGFIRMFCWSFVSERQIIKLRSQHFESIMHRELAWYEQKSLGELSLEMTEDIENIREGIDEKLALFVQEITTFIASYILAFVRGWQLTLLLMAAMPFLLVTAFVTSTIMLTWNKKERKAYAKAATLAQSVLSNIKVIAAFGNQENEAVRYDDSLKEAEVLGCRKSWIFGLFRGFSKGIIFLLFSIAIWFSWLLITKIDPAFSSGSLFTVFFCVIMGSIYLGRASPYLSTLGLARVSAAVVFSTIDGKSVIDSSSKTGHSTDGLVGNVEFNNVDFYYPLRKTTKVLNEVKFSVKSGETVAIIGPSGMGKTTIAKLIHRLYDPSSGQVLIDGKDIRRFNVHELRKFIGIVPQSSVLFNTTIMNNITHGADSDFSEEDVYEASRIANALEFILELPQKFDTLVGDKGCQLSGGQKQRVCLARALIKKPKILLLDQTCSALDTESEAKVLNNLKKSKNNRTTIFITHRIATIRNADVIVSIEHGKVVENGKYEDLIQNKGICFLLSTLQIKTDKNNSIKVGDFVTRSSSKDNVKSSFKEDCLLEMEADIESNFEEEEIKADKGSLLQILKLNKPEWAYIVGGSLTAAVSSTLFPIFGFLAAISTKYLSETDATKIYNGVVLLCPILAALFVIAFITCLINNALFGISGEKLTRRVRGLSFHALLHHNPDWFEDATNSTSNLTIKLSRDAPRIKFAAGQAVGIITEAVSCVLMGLFIAMFFNWRLALFSLVQIPLVAVSQLFRGKMFLARSNRNKANNESAMKIAMESLSNLTTIMILGKEDFFVAHFKDKIKQPLRKILGSIILESLAFGISSFSFFIPIAVVFRYAGYLMRLKLILFHDVLVVFLVIQITGVTLGSVAISFTDIKKGKTSAARIFKALEDIPTIDLVSKQGKQPVIKGDLEISDCSFSYPNRREATALNNFSVSVKCGDTMALVGQSGCGKSTVIQLIERFYDCDKGKILIDGIDIKDYNIQHLRKNIGIVFQDPVLFHGTIKENIAFGIDSESYKIKDVEAAAIMANIHNFIISLEKGYETQIGYEGNQLSRGQKQRISIARAVIRNPKILLLDEATSSLDTESEKCVQQALEQACIGRTCIVIAHRLSTIRNATCIAVMADGSIIETGSHDELMSSKGTYHQLVTSIETLS